MAELDTQAIAKKPAAEELGAKGTGKGKGKPADTLARPFCDECISPPNHAFSTHACSIDLLEQVVLDNYTHVEIRLGIEELRLQTHFT